MNFTFGAEQLENVHSFFRPYQSWYLYWFKISFVPFSQELPCHVCIKCPHGGRVHQ